MGSLATELQKIRRDIDRLLRHEMPIVGPSGTVPAPIAQYDHIEADATPAWTRVQDLTLADDTYIGLPGPGGRIVLDSTPAPDQLKITDADLNFVTAAHGIIHVDGVAAGMVLRADGTRFVPAAAASTLPVAPLAVGDTLIATAGPVWDILATPGAAGYARVSTATTEAWNQTPAWTGEHSFADGIALNGVSGANEISIPDNMAIAFELEDVGGREYLRIISDNTQQVVVFNEDGGNTDFRVESDNRTHMFFVDGGNDRVGVGVAPTDGLFHAQSATAGAVAASAVGDEGVFENSGDGGISILTPAANTGAVFFGSPTSATRGWLAYDHPTDELLFGVESNTQFKMTADEFEVLAGNWISATGIRATLANAEGLHVPWITGDADTTAYFGSTNASNNQIAVEVETYSNIGIKCTAVTGIALVADSASGDIANFREGGVTRWEILNGGDLTAVAGDLRMNNNSIILDNDLDTEISAKSADDQIDITIAGADDFTFTANSLNVLPGSSIYLSGYMYHLGDTNTLMRFQTDRYTLTCGGIQMIDAFETGTNYLNLHAGLVGINETANANMAIGLTIDQAANGDEILNFRSSDVGAVLSKIETGTFLNVTKAQGDSGGATIRTLKDADGVNYAALDLVALLAEDTDVVKTTSARGIVEICSFQTDGSALEDTVSNGNTVALRTRRGGSVVTTHWFDEDGDFGYNGSLISYDHLDDAAMARDLQLVLTGRRGVQYNQEAMVKAGILHPSEHGIMVSHKRMTALQLGAIRQGYEDRLALERRVKYLEKELKKWQ